MLRDIIYICNWLNFKVDRQRMKQHITSSEYENDKPSKIYSILMAYFGLIPTCIPYKM